MRPEDRTEDCEMRGLASLMRLGYAPREWECEKVSARRTANVRSFNARPAGRISSGWEHQREGALVVAA
eukprot:COSAG01_NODE_12058_length_1806_cov_30.504979_2_plen_69_part_00